MHKRLKPGWNGIFEVKHFTADGTLLHSESCENSLVDEGEADLLDVYLRGATPPTALYIGLVNDTPIETDSLTDLTGEPSTGGYGRQTVERSVVGWPTLALDAGDYQATSKTVTFAASGGSIGPVTHMICATSSDNTGKLVSAAALSQSRTLADGESLQVTYKVKLA